MDNNKELPIVGISIGDVNGIGPELVMRVFSDNRLSRICTPVIYAPGKVFSFGRKFYNLNNFNYNQIKNIDHATSGKVNVLSLNSGDSLNIEPGKPSKESGTVAFESLKSATEDLKSGKIDVLVTCPINKEFIQNKDFDFPGHTEYLTRTLDSSESLMFMICDELKVAVVTGHVALSEVPKRITKEAIVKKTNLLIKSLKKDFGINKPKIAILGLNPHAGEGGLLGKEEIEVIQPAIEEFKNKNAIVMGPYPADGFFGNYSFKKFDAVLAMYHDQGLTPFKTIAFDKGVNFTAGLSKIRTSPDHGTAYDMVGKGNISTTSFREAIYSAINIYKTRIGETKEKEPLFNFD